MWCGEETLKEQKKTGKGKLLQRGNTGPTHMVSRKRGIIHSPTPHDIDGKNRGRSHIHQQHSPQALFYHQ